MSASLREASLPRFALRRGEAAASLSISPATFDNWVSEGKMPRGRKIGGVMLWDTESVRTAWYALADIDTSQPDNDNPYEGIVL